MSSRLQPARARVPGPSVTGAETSAAAPAQGPKREDPIPSTSVPLATVVEYLQSHAGEPLVARLMETVETHGYWERLDTFPTESGALKTVRYEHRQDPNRLPDDAFERELVQRVDNTLELFFTPIMRPSIIPAVVGEMLAARADDDGQVHLETLPPDAGRDLLLELVKGLETETPDGGRPTVTYTYTSAETQRKLLLSQPFETFSARMPVLQRLVDAYAGPDTLQGWIVGEQAHQLRHSLPKLDALEACGARIAFNSGKVYSTPKDVQAHLRHLKGLWGPEEPRDRRSAPNEERMYAAACDRLDALFSNDGLSPDARYSLFSDGAYLIRALHAEPRFRPFSNRCVAGEQTQFGGEYVEELERAGVLDLDVWAMWRCQAKKRYESPAIGENVLFHMETYLTEAQAELKLDPTQPALVVGAGAVGMACAAALERRGFPRANILLVDRDPQVQARVRAEGYGTSVPEAVMAKAHVHGSPERAQVLGLADVAITATPGRAIVPDEWDLLKDGCKVANAGSGNHGFGADDEEATHEGERRDFVNSREGLDGHEYVRFQGAWVRLGDVLALPGERTRHRVIRTESDKQLFFFRGGYVVNFGKGGLPPEIAQLTNGLILGIQLLSAKHARPPEELGPGQGRIVDVPQKLEEDLVRWTQECLAAYGTSLEDPDFRKLPRWF